MYKRILFALVALFGALIVYFRPELDSEKDKFRLFLASHPFNQTERMSSSELKKMPKQDRPDLAWQQDYLRTLDPSLGRPAQERLEAIHDYVTTYNSSVAPAVPGSQSAPWVERGPSNVGGRTRALLWDPNDATGKKVWAGGVTGGLWYNNDITNSNSSWISVGNFWDNIAITCIAADPNNSSILYVGTGEGWWAGSSRGGGIWKSSNGGATWNRLMSTASFYFINDLVVRNESGTSVVYAAVSGGYYNGVWHGASNSGLQRSINGGSAWSQTLPTIPGTSINYVAADIEISANNRLWIGTNASPFAATDRGGGRILYSDNGTTWTTSYTAAGIVNGDGRVELATAPSNANYVYGIIENSSVVHGIVRTTNSGSSWSSLNEPVDDDSGIPATDFSRGQAWYDLILAVDPSNPNKVIAGAINAHLSTNGGQSWSQISKWSNNSNMGSQPYSFIHADHHQILYKPGSANELIFGTDGGVFWTNSFSSATTSSVFDARNKEYNVTQFYAGAIHPTAGSNHMLAGAQDNGTLKFTIAGVNATTEVTGGDGAFCFIDQTNANIQISSYVYNSFYRSTDGGNNFSSIQNDPSTGSFINPADYDDVFNVLYSARTSSTLNRIRNVETTPSTDFINIAGMSSMATHVRTSPYASGSSTIFVGTGAGDIFKVTNANGISPSSTSLGSSLPAGSISCVELGANENELLVTYSNYGVNSIWYSTNGGATWVSKEGNLPDMPVRWALFNPLNRAEVLLATEVGVWSTQNFNSTSPTWTPSNSGLSHVRVDMLQIRDSDKMVMAITHGRGVFTSDGFNTSAPVADFGVSNPVPCTGQTVVLSDSSSGSPTNYSWTIVPSTFSFVNGTSSTSASPSVQFNSVGSYTVRLTVSNSQGTDTLTQFVHAGGGGIPYLQNFEQGGQGWTVSNPDNLTTWALYNVGTSSNPNWTAYMDNYDYNAPGQRDGLISPPLNLTGLSSASLTFSHAYRRFNSQLQDSLAVFISTNCGTTWTRIASYKENGTGNFATGPDLSSEFFPTSNTGWCGTAPVCATISLNSYVGSANVLVKFENINGFGNNMYLDNIALNGIQATPPIADFVVSSTSPCIGQSVQFTDLTQGNPTGWSWSFSPNTVAFTNGTAPSSQNPQVSFSQAGTYQVALVSTNSYGTDSEVKAGFIVVGSPVTPSVNIASSASIVCSGAPIVFTASPVNGGTAPSYQWKVNGSLVGVNSPTYTSSTLANGDLVSVELTSNALCAASNTAVSNSIAVSVTQSVTPTVAITASTTSICAGSSMVFTAIPVNGGSAPLYQWKINGSNVGGSSSVFSTSTLSSNDVVTVELASSFTCVTSSTALSNGIAVTVNPQVVPSVAISASANSVCSGAPIVFTASPVNGGTAPSYQWKVNGVNVGTNSAVYGSSTLNNNDVVIVEMTSSAGCVSSASVLSSPLVVAITQPSVPGVGIQASSTNICAGEQVQFTALPTNGGTNPIYTWKVNGVNTGVSSNLFSTSSLNNYDLVSAEMASSLTCITAALVSSNVVPMTVNAIPSALITNQVVNVLCSEDTLNLVGAPTGGVFSSTSSGLIGQQFIPLLAGNGSHWIRYTITGAGGCVGIDSLEVEVENIPVPTVSVSSDSVLTCNEQGYLYQWYSQSGLITGATGQSHTVTSNGSYHVEISTQHCSSSSNSVLVNTIGTESIPGLSIDAYPNPASNWLVITAISGSSKSISMVLYNSVGQMIWVKDWSISQGLNEKMIDVSSFATGIYQLRVTDESKEVVRRIEVL